MNVQNFYDMMEKESAKQRVYQEIIPSCFRRAVQFIEQNYDIGYMRTQERLTLSAATLPFRAAQYKSLIAIERVHIGDDLSECYHPLPRVQRGMITSREIDAHPQGYMQWGDTITFDAYGIATPTVIDMYSVKYTDFDCLTPSDTHPLINQFEGAILSRAMLELMAYAREPDWAQTYGSLWETHTKTLTMAQDAFDYSGDHTEWRQRET